MKNKFKFWKEKCLKDEDEGPKMKKSGVKKVQMKRRIHSDSGLKTATPQNKSNKKGIMSSRIVSDQPSIEKFLRKSTPMTPSNSASTPYIENTTVVGSDATLVGKKKTINAKLETGARAEHSTEREYF